jgi:glycosyltransferase involved in cell wall biosynthesis
LDSVVNQTYKNIEIILVDDCGRDSSMRIAENYEKQDDRIKIVRHQQNFGLSAARNTGIRNSSAPYIMFVDSDDYVDPAFCEKMLAGIENSGADCAVCAVNLVYSDDFADRKGNKYWDLSCEGLQIVGWRAILAMNVVAWNKIYRRDLIEKLDLQFPVGTYYEDNPFWCLYGSLCRKIFFVNERLYTYRRINSSITGTSFSGKLGRYPDLIKNIIWLYDFMNRKGIYEENFELYWMFFIGQLKAALHYRVISGQEI